MRMRIVARLGSYFFAGSLALASWPGMAAKKESKAPPSKNKKIVVREKNRSVKNPGGGADRVEGYIIKRQGKNIIKIPKKQVFEFGGAQVEGSAQSPSQSVFGKRPTPRPGTLIPERQSFRNEFFESAGLGER